MKSICIFPLVLLLAFPLSSFSQIERFVTTGTRLSRLPQQAFIDDFDDIYRIDDFSSRPALKMGVGLRFPISRRGKLECEVAYSINPFDYLKNREIGEGTRLNTLKIESFDYAGYIGFLEFASHIDYSLDTKNRWEVFAGIRFTSIYYTRQKGIFTREEFVTSVSSGGNPRLAKVDDYETRVGVSDGGLALYGLPELGLRSWCLQKGKAGFELSGGVSLSSIFLKDFRLRAHFIGLAYIQRWRGRKRNKQKI